MRAIILIFILLCVSNAYSKCLESDIDENILNSKIFPLLDGDGIFIVRVTAPNTWNELKLGSLSLMKDDGNVGISMQKQPYNLDENYTIASFFGTEKWLKDTDFCIAAAYKNPTSGENDFSGYTWKIIPIAFNQQLKAGTPARDAASGAP